MTIRPSLEEARGIAESGQYRMVPISAEMYSDMVTPIDVLRKLKNVSRHCFILESAEDTKNWGRYTFLGFDPSMEITCLDGVMGVKSNAGQGGASSFETDNPNIHIQEILDWHKSAKLDFLPPFTGGLVGYFAYDYAKYAEPSLKLDAR
ncbi:MAG: anthranilate synthase component I, partial [Treponema sp.]|nr:anthranilate synthase component I [Treponema sp.]